jgi:hypothetical protein
VKEEDQQDKEVDKTTLSNLHTGQGEGTQSITLEQTDEVAQIDPPTIDNFVEPREEILPQINEQASSERSLTSPTPLNTDEAMTTNTGTSSLGIFESIYK